MKRFWKKILPYLQGLAFGFTIGCIIVVAYKCQTENKVIPGQRWLTEDYVFSFQDVNPFECDTATVIDVERKFVLYSVHKDTFSESVEEFLRHSIKLHGK